MIYKVELQGRDSVEVEVEASGRCKIKAVACSELTQLLKDLKKKSAQVAEWPLPSGNSHSEILIRELILRVQGNWEYPIKDLETCHCRAVPTEKIDQAVIAGAHNIEKVRRLTSANTACGTCLPEIEKIFKRRLA